MAVLAINKRASFDYEIQKSYEAGIILLGHETKALRFDKANLKGAYVSFKNGEAYLIKAHIPLYKSAGNIENYDPERERKILLNKKELNYLLNKKEEKGLTVIPIKLYTKGSLIKLEIAVVRGKKSFDKREDIKKKDIDKRLRTLTKQKLRG